MKVWEPRRLQRNSGADARLFIEHSRNNPFDCLNKRSPTPNGAYPSGLSHSGMAEFAPALAFTRSKSSEHPPKSVKREALTSAHGWFAVVRLGLMQSADQKHGFG